MIIDSHGSIKGADSREVMRAALTDSLNFYNELFALMQAAPHLSQRAWSAWRESHGELMKLARAFRASEEEQHD
jgi:hypothetical protein